MEEQYHFTGDALKQMADQLLAIGHVDAWKIVQEATRVFKGIDSFDRDGIAMYYDSKDSDFFHTFLFVEQPEGRYELFQVGASFQWPSDNDILVNYIKKTFTAEDGRLPNKSEIEEMVLLQVARREQDKALREDQRLRNEFISLGVLNYDEMAAGMVRHANLAYMGTRKKMEWPSSLNEHTVEFRFIVVLPGDGASPLISIMKVSFIPGENWLNIEPVEKVFSRKVGGLPSIHGAMQAIRSALEVKVEAFDRIAGMFQEDGRIVSPVLPGDQIRLRL